MSCISVKMHPGKAISSKIKQILLDANNNNAVLLSGRRVFHRTVPAKMLSPFFLHFAAGRESHQTLSAGMPWANRLFNILNRKWKNRIFFLKNLETSQLRSLELSEPHIKLLIIYSVSYLTQNQLCELIRQESLSPYFYWNYA